jgi:hypothetical protein
MAPGGGMHLHAKRSSILFYSPAKAIMLALKDEDHHSLPYKHVSRPFFSLLLRSVISLIYIEGAHQLISHPFRGLFNTIKY